MKLTKTQLKRIIQEELQKVLYVDQNSKQRIEEDWASRKREAKMGKDELQRKIDRARFLQRQRPSTSMTADEYERIHGKGSVEAANPRPVNPDETITVDEYERIHGKGSVEAANPRPVNPDETITVDEYERIHGKGSASSNYAECPRGQKPIGQRNDGSPICG